MGARAALPERVEADPRWNLSPWAVRPYLFERQKSYALSAELIGRGFPKHAPDRSILTQAVLQDLAWLASYLQATSEEVRGLAPPRRELEAFLTKKAPQEADEWLRVHFLDEPTRWEFRVKVPTHLGSSLNQLLLPTMTWGYSFTERRALPEAKQEVRDVAMAELSMAVNALPEWKEDISKIRRSVEKATRRRMGNEKDPT